MALTQSYVGTTSVGASFQALTNFAYAKLVTIPANSVLSSIEAYMQFTNGQSPAFRVAVWSDNAGALNDLLSLSQPKVESLLTSGNDRWLGGAVGMWFGSDTNVWIGVQMFDNSGAALAYEATGGSDVTVATGGVWTGEQGAAGTTVTVTTRDQSIRGLVIQ